MVSAFASYAFGIAALVFGVLGYLQTEMQWWPAALCVVLGYLCSRGAVVCLDHALTQPAPQGPGFSGSWVRKASD